jgi:hypothetical protein
MPVKWPWSRDTDPYWDRFINGPLADRRNLLPEGMRTNAEGASFPGRADVHTPEITSGHIKELATFLGAEMVGIVALDPSDAASGDYPWGIVCVVKAEYDPRTSAGIGGQTPVMNGIFVSFILASYIRELGYRATSNDGPPSEPLAAAAGLGRLDGQGRLVTPQHGTKVHVATVVRTDLPLAADRVGSPA